MLINPLRRWFESQGHRQPVGIVDRDGEPAVFVWVKVQLQPSASLRPAGVFTSTEASQCFLPPFEVIEPDVGLQAGVHEIRSYQALGSNPGVSGFVALNCTQDEGDASSVRQMYQVNRDPLVHPTPLCRSCIQSLRARYGRSPTGMTWTSWASCL